MVHTDYINLTNDELLTATYTKEGVTSLEMELAQRLETVLNEVDSLTTDEPSLEEVLDKLER